SGIVPHRDGLGFLDLLLYGTSVGVITQESAHGVKVVGAGSFAVTKKSPFVMDAFVSARRYLVNQAKCAVFVGPATDDEDRLHPIAGNVDLVVLVRSGERLVARVLDPLEEAIASLEGVEAWSVRINTRAAAVEPRPAAVPPRSAGKTEPALVAEVEELVEKIAEKPEWAEMPREAPEPEAVPRAGRAAPAAQPPLRAGGGRAEPAEHGPFGEKKGGGSRFIRVAAAVVAVALVAFVVWWLYLTRSVRDGGEKSATPGAPGASAVAVPPPADSLAAAKTARERVESLIARNRTPARPGGPASAPTTETSQGGAPETGAAGGGEPVRAAEEPREAPAQTGRSLSTADNIHVAESLSEFADQYIVHVSSFHGIEKAGVEARDLIGWGYPVFLYRVDLGSKGIWYRVYVGPYATRESAMEHKIKLDENPRIKSTRISKVPG
ncbi:MAG: Sporulation related domain, partial [Candidatus Krumholzibacteriota bacterium]|nr:Sporulation related domain [Candidatus Krumholzibacteriota bacterium]